MPAGNPARLVDSATRGFRALALRRNEYYLELLKSGRWTRYFTEQQFAERLRDVMDVTKFWNDVVQASEEEPAPETRSAA